MADDDESDRRDRNFNLLLKLRSVSAVSGFMSVLPAVATVGECTRTLATEAARRDVVLVVDDDDLVAAVLTRLLERRGDRVVRAHDGASGAQAFARHERHIRLVIIDCCLPDIDGVRLGRALRHIVPKLPLLVVSGWEFPAAVALAENGPTRFLAKPFTPSELASELDQLAAAVA